MKKLLAIIIALLLVMTFSDHPPLSGYKQQALQWFSSKTQTATQQSQPQRLQQLTQELTAVVASMGKGQQTAIQEMTKSPEEVDAFQQKYCVQGQFHPLFFGDSIRTICQLIANYRS